MTAILLEPHQDDAVLFAAYTCCAFQPHVITVLASQLQEDRGTGITNGEREFENKKALALLGCTNEQWEFSDADPDWRAIAKFTSHRVDELRPDLIIGPAWEPDGHEHHNAVFDCISLAWPAAGDHRRSYLTYRRGHGKSKGSEVIPEPEWIVAKLKALACFGSQIREPTTRPWFVGDLREWVP